jgi:hypothetical protein
MDNLQAFAVSMTFAHIWAVIAVLRFTIYKDRGYN